MTGHVEGTGEKRNAYRVFFRNLKDKDKFRGLFLDWGRVFNLIRNKYDRRGKNRFAWLRIVGGRFEEDSKDLLHKMEGWRWGGNSCLTQELLAYRDSLCSMQLLTNSFNNLIIKIILLWDYTRFS
jgi:hypothetical protein